MSTLLPPVAALTRAADALAAWYGADWPKFTLAERVAMTREVAEKDLADRYTRAVDVDAIPYATLA